MYMYYPINSFMSINQFNDKFILKFGQYKNVSKKFRKKNNHKLKSQMKTFEKDLMVKKIKDV